MTCPLERSGHIGYDSFEGCGDCRSAVKSGCNCSFDVRYLYGVIIMEYVRVTKENLEKEHICCAISNNKDIQVSSKKAWLMDRFDDGLVFLKSTERGK